MKLWMRLIEWWVSMATKGCERGRMLDRAGGMRPRLAQRLASHNLGSLHLSSISSSLSSTAATTSTAISLTEHHHTHLYTQATPNISRNTLTTTIIHRINSRLGNQLLPQPPRNTPFQDTPRLNSLLITPLPNLSLVSLHVPAPFPAFP